MCVVGVGRVLFKEIITISAFFNIKKTKLKELTFYVKKLETTTKKPHKINVAKITKKERIF